MLDWHICLRYASNDPIASTTNSRINLDEQEDKQSYEHPQEVQIDLLQSFDATTQLSNRYKCIACVNLFTKTS